MLARTWIVAVGVVSAGVAGCRDRETAPPPAAPPPIEAIKQAITIPTVSNASNFNGTAIASGRWIWFTSVMKVTGVGTTPVHLYMNGGHLKFTASSVAYDLNVPDSRVTIDPAATSATTTFNTATNTWETTVPKTFSGNAFLGAFAWQVPVNLPGGINPVTWSAQFESDAAISVNWQWAAAVYTSFTGTYNALGVKPVDDSSLSSWHNSDHAGTPENYKSFVVGGARGGGGSDHTGSLSGTVSLTPTQACQGVTCTASDQCHAAGTCNPVSGLCNDPIKQDGTPCVDGDACTQTDMCQAGVCVGSNPVVCGPGCSSHGTCDPVTGHCSASTGCPGVAVCGNGVIEGVGAVTSIELSWLTTSCAWWSGGSDIIFRLNGEVLLTSFVPSTCTCYPGISTQTISDPGILARIQNGANTLSVEYPEHLGWAVARLVGDGTTDVTIFDAAGGAETRDPYLCR